MWRNCWKSTRQDALISVQSMQELRTVELRYNVLSGSIHLVYVISEVRYNLYPVPSNMERVTRDRTLRSATAECTL